MAILRERDEPSVEQMVDRRGQEETVLAIKPFLVVAITPRPNVARSKMLEPLHTRDSPPSFQSSQVLLEDPLAASGENELHLLGVADRPVR